MPDRTPLLVHLRRVSGLLEKAIREGPDGTLEGKFAAEHPAFIHYTSAMYLAACLAFLEGREGSYSWRDASTSHPDFDTFAAASPPSKEKHPKESFQDRGVTVNALEALACVRNAVVHNDGDLAKNTKADCLAMVQAAKLPGAALNGTEVVLENGFLGFVRLATLAVRMYHGES